ncbi:hypothetical protein ES703_98686 [subsurface metagenome]
MRYRGLKGSRERYWDTFCPICSVTLIHKSITSIYRSSSVISLSSALRLYPFASSSASPRSSRFSFILGTSERAKVSPDLVPKSNPNLLISSKTSTVVAFPYFCQILLIISARTFLSTNLFSNSISSGRISLNITLPGVVWTHFPSTSSFIL